MVYCSKCGTKNEDDVTFCVSCGANLTARREKRADEYEEMCFGRRGNSQIGWIIFGAIILIVGISSLLQQFYDIDLESGWPFIVVLIGTVIIVSAILNQRAVRGRRT